MARFSKKHYEFLAAFLAYERSVSTGKNWDAEHRTRNSIVSDGLATSQARTDLTAVHAK